MLVLTRRVNEAVELRDTRTGEFIGTVMVLGVAGAIVRIGFDSPKHVQIMRDDTVNKRRKEDEDTGADDATQDI